MADQSAEIERRSFTEKQKLALASTARFLLFGGGAGGGKSEWAIFDGLGLNNPGGGVRAIDFKNYTGLFLRRTLPQLRDIIKRTQDIYPVWGADPKTGAQPTWKEQQKVWVFPSGARIFFGYVDKPSDVFNYQGWEYQWICFEELTQWPSIDPFLYLHTRLRKLEDSPIQIGMRATCNPGGVGHNWVRSFWQIDDEGSPTHFSVPTVIEIDGEKQTIDLDRQFIPARLDENPFLSRAEYAAALEDPAQSEQTRRALREGRWDIVDLKGVVYAEQMADLHRAAGVTTVPYDPRYPVNTFWDMGTSDFTAIWFHQRIDGIDYFIDYYEAQNRGLKDHHRELQLRNYNYGVHFLPHDAEQRRHNLGGNIMTVLDIMEDLGFTSIEIVPKVPQVWQGIEQVRIVLSRCRFDWGKCELGLSRLSNYRFKEDGRGRQPVHDENSHGADAFRQFAQAYDMIPGAIESAMVENDPVPDVPWARKNSRKMTRRRWLV